MNTQPQYDQHQFVRVRTRAVEAHVTADGFETTGISFQDYDRMHRVSTGSAPRRNGIPEWANSDESLRERVLDMLERRLYLRSHKGMTNAQRLERIDATAKAGIPALKEALAERVRRYSEAPTPRLEIQIQNFDSDIVLRQRGIASVMIAVVYKSYRLGWNSTQVANDLLIKAPTIRLWLWRLNRGNSGYAQKKIVVKIRKVGNRIVRSINMPIRQYWTQEEIATVVRLFNEGETGTRIAISLGRTVCSVAYIINKHVRHNR